jgi:hypothetical protein
MWAWTGRIKPGSSSDAVVGPIDVYPTVIDLIGVPKPAQQRFDGVSYAKVLKSEGGLKRTAYFNYHPHAGANRAGGVWVRIGDFKLLRWFGNPATHELFNLREDIRESKDLANQMPDKVKELKSLIDGFLQDTGAAFPLPNPACKPVAAKVSVKSTDPLEGWKERGCKASITDGILSLKSTGKSGSAFLGHGMAKLAGPAAVKIRVRSQSGGAGKIESYPNGSADATGMTAVPLEIKAGDWQELELDLAGKSPLGTLRVYLPDAEIDFIEVAPAKGKPQRWNF